MYPMIMLALYSITHCSDILPDDPFQQHAIQVLAGDFGPQPKWKLKGYRLGLEQGVRADTLVWLTCYYGSEPSGRTDHHEQLCSLRTASANKIGQFGFIWSKFTGLRQVTDTGSHHNDYLAFHPLRDPVTHRRLWQPAELWADIWYQSASDHQWRDSQTYACAVIQPG